MTVQASDPFESTSGNGIAVSFGFSFPAISAKHVFSLVDNEFQGDASVVLNPDQSNDPGGNITFTSPPAIGSIVYIYRQTEASQQLLYPTAGRFPAKATERSLDKLTMLLQEAQSDASSRALRVPAEELTVPPLPPIAERANRTLGFDAAGNPIVAGFVETGARGPLTVSTSPPQGIPSDNQEWVMIGMVDEGSVGNAPPPEGTP